MEVAPLTAFLAVFNTGVDIAFPVTEIHAILDSHVRRVCITGGRESACPDIVTILYQSEAKLSRKVRGKTNV
jgi:hypothetical protein